LGSGESVAGILTTADNVLFAGDAQGNLLVLDAATGKTLWHASAGGSMVSSPMTYALACRMRGRCRSRRAAGLRAWCASARICRTMPFVKF
jgi:outer membrane protein assembly factor BamB